MTTQMIFFKKKIKLKQIFFSLFFLKSPNSFANIIQQQTQQKKKHKSKFSNASNTEITIQNKLI